MNEQTPTTVRRGPGRPRKHPLPEVPKPPAELPMIEDVMPQPQPPPEIKRAYINVFDVVQVINQTSPFYGTLFIVGDVQAGKVHGFHMMSGGRREFVTAGVDEVFPIGVSKTRSKEPVSTQWAMEYKKP